MRHRSKCLIVSAAVAVVALFMISTAMAITLEPILHYSFDTATGLPGSTIVDESITGYDGVVNVGLTPVTGQFNSALEFAGGAYIGLWNPVLSTQDAYQPYTLSCWVRTTATGGFITQYGTTGDDYALRFGTGIWDAGVGKPQWWQNGIVQAFSNVAVNDGTWHHMAYVKDANQNLSLYVDGVDQTDPGYANQHTSPFMNARMRIGTFVSGTLNYTGTMDEVQIYNTALTPAQIVELRDNNEVTISSGPSVLQVDFGKYGQGIQPGWQDFSRLDSGPAAKDFAFGTSGVNIAIADTDVGPHWQDRVGSEGMTIDSIQHPVGKVAMDFVFGGSNQNFDVTLSGLDPGTYYARTYHHDPRTNYGTIGVGVTDANGSRTVASSTPITYGAEHSIADDIASPGNIGTVPMKITVDGSGQAVINLLPATTYTHLNGLEMTTDLPTDLKVDFQVAGGDTQSGYQAYEQPTETNAVRPQAHWFFTELGRQGSARVEIRGNDGDTFSPRNRGDVVHAKGDLVEDFFSPSISSTIALGNLKAGQYQVTTYHHDMNVLHSPLDVSVTDTDGADRSVVTGLAQTTGSTPASPASATFTINTSGILPVEIDYASDSAIIHNSVEVEKIGTGTDPKTLKVYLVGGQSNADGRGTSSALPSEWQQLQSDVPTYHGGAWQELQPGLTTMSSDLFGPELSFGRAMVEGEDEFVAVIKYANGGTDLANDWRPGGGGDPGGADWQAFVAAVDDASLAFGEDLAPEFAGMIWMQGESDTGDLAQAQAYETNLTDFITSVRDLVETPDMPFVIGRILDYPSYTYADIVRQAQADVAADMDGVSMIDTDDLEVISGNANHYSNDGLLELGQRFADALLTITPGDANRDGYVDVTDLGILATNYGAGSGFGWEDADFTGDGLVNVEDLGILATYYGTTQSPQSVPEPNVFILLVMGLASLILIRRK